MASMVWRSQFHVVSIFQPKSGDLGSPWGSSGRDFVLNFTHPMPANRMDWATSPMWVVVEVVCEINLLFSSRRALSTIDKREGLEALKTSQQ